MISKILIQGFQIHKNLSLELDPYLTLIIGDNDSGKSAILRALRWLCLNEWDGSATDYICWDQHVCQVKLICDDGCTIKRFRSSTGGNHYYLDRQKFSSFSTTVPRPIHTLLSMSGENFQHQCEPAFWLSLSPPQAARELNKIVHLDGIDTSLSYVSKELFRAKTKVTIAKESLAQARTTRQKYSWVVEAQKSLSKIESLQEEIDRKAARIASIERYQTEATRLQAVKDNASEAILRIGKAITMSEQVNTLEEKIKSLQKALALLKNQRSLQKRLSQCEEDLKKFLKGKCPLCERGP